MMIERLDRLTKFAYLAQFRLIDDLDAAAVDSDDFLLGKCRQGAYGIACCHVRQVGQVFSSHVNLERLAVVFIAVVVDEHRECLGKTAAYVLLGEVHYTCVGAAQVLRQLMNENHASPVLLSMISFTTCMGIVPTVDGSNAAALDT